jgi:hypothetical protein
MRQLVEIISSRVSEIDAIFEKQGIDYPSLEDPFVFGSPSEIAAMGPDVGQCTALVVAACAQLSSMLNAPAATLYGISGGVSYSPCFLFHRLLTPPLGSHRLRPKSSSGKQHSRNLTWTSSRTQRQ